MPCIMREIDMARHCGYVLSNTAVEDFKRAGFPSLQIAVHSSASGVSIRNMYSTSVKETDARREETTTTLIADICANERRLKQ